MQDFLKEFMEYVERNKKIIIGVIAIAVVVAVVAGVGGNGARSIVLTSTANRGMTQSVSGGMVAPSMAPGAYGEGVAYDNSVGMKGTPSSIMPPIYNNPPASTPTLPFDRKVIQNGSLDLLVENADTAAKQIETIATTNNGFIDSSNLYEVSDGVKAGSITVRVPADKFAGAMEAIKAVALKVNRETVSSDDVTAQVVDLQAQIKNYQAEEEQYRQIMAKAVKIQDVLDVASRLSQVQGQIERTQGQLNYVSRQVAMSTISISLTAEPEVQVFGIVWRPGTVVQQAFKSMLVNLANFANWLINLIFVLPVLILQLGFAILVLWILWKILKRIVRSFSGPQQ